MAFINIDKITDIDEITDIKDLMSLQLDTDDVFGEISDDVLMAEFSNRGLEDELEIDKELSEFSISEIANHLSQLPSYELKDLLCDMVGVNHHTSKEDIMKLIAERI